MSTNRPDDLSYSFEFFPPKGETVGQAFWDAVDALSALAPRFVSVTYGAGGTTRARTYEMVSEIAKRYPFPAAAHLTCVGATQDEINGIVRGYWDAGIKHIVALRGDPPAGTQYTPTPDGYPYSSDLVEGIKKIAGFEVSVAGYPETHPDSPSPEADIIALKKKQDAGADRVLTQFFMETDDFLNFRDRAVKAGVTIPICPGIFPINHYARAASFAQRCGAGMPAWVGKIFEGLDPEGEAHKAAAIDLAVKQCDTLIRAGVDHLHFYTLNKADLTIAVCEAL